MTDWIAAHTTTALERLSTGILSLFRSAGHASRLCVFGSFASGSWDQWSDLDLAVACADPCSHGALLAGQLDATLPVLCHCPFPGQPAPSGRFWFRDQSPFHKLDVSFHTERDLQSVMEKWAAEGATIAVHEATCQARETTCRPFRWEFSTTQCALEDILHRVSRYHRRFVRAGEAAEELRREFQALRRFLDSHSPVSAQDEAYWELAHRMMTLVGETSQPSHPAGPVSPAASHPSKPGG